MPRITFQLDAPIADSFRVRQVCGMFDLPHAPRSSAAFDVELPGLDEPWTIGAIVGPSGSGKSSVARRAYQDGAIARDALAPGFDWPRDAAIVDGFDAALDGRTITAMLNAVGLSSPPAWVRPWQALSTGQRFRCELARALLLERELVVFDEFSSVVDRQAARFGSAAVARALRRGRARCRRFVAVTCHYDVLPWLGPDWWLDMGLGRLARRSLPRPRITLELRRCARDLWPLFAPHHYLSSELHPSARCYAALWEGRPIGFCATLALLGRRGRRHVHRLVVLPDYQGLGGGRALLDAVAQVEAAGAAVGIVTSHPALIRSLARSARWHCTRVHRCGRPHAGVSRARGRRLGAVGRITASFAFEPARAPRAAGPPASCPKSSSSDTNDSATGSELPVAPRLAQAGGAA